MDISIVADQNIHLLLRNFEFSPHNCLHLLKSYPWVLHIFESLQLKFVFHPYNHPVFRVLLFDGLQFVQGNLPIFDDEHPFVFLLIVFNVQTLLN